MGHGGKMHGVPVSECEVATGLGFKSVSDFRLFQKHVGEVQKIVGPRLNRIFGDRPDSQWCFEIASAVTEYFISFVADRPADDEPATEEWLLSALPFVKDNDDYAASFAGNWLLIRFEEHRIVCHIESDSTDAIVRLNNPKTRGDVRQLCKALGIKVTEETHL